jgi:hypothetical protein
MPATIGGFESVQTKTFDFELSETGQEGSALLMLPGSYGGLKSSGTKTYAKDGRFPLALGSVA